LAGVAYLAFEEAFLAVAVAREYLVGPYLASVALTFPYLDLYLLEAYAITHPFVVSGSIVAYFAFDCPSHHVSISFLFDIYSVLLGYILVFSFRCD